ncbi:S41 family peptidase [Pseudomonas sp. CGJS7]|uniref:S41 family peptidase n=1 Tax=Pseudomonas sp. CGJS7 TaxID=3109348 RepID=UPI003009CD71
MDALTRLRSVLAVAVLAAVPFMATAAPPPERLSVEQLRQDLDVVAATLREQHPDIAHSIAPAELDRALADLRRDLRRPLTREQAWLRLAELNPRLADAHVSIGYPDWRGLAKAQQAAGPGWFPFEVRIDPDTQQLFVAAELGGGASDQARARIVRIDGVDSRVVVRRLLKLVHGDTPAFRARLLQDRWFYYYWRAYGEPATFRIVLDRAGAKPLSVAAAKRTPAALAVADDFERSFRFEVRPGGDAVLTIASFVWPDRERFFAFTDDAFARIKRESVRRLLIDVRDNGGGDDELWTRGILRHIATRPYRTGSTYRKRVLEKFRSGDEVVGQVVRGEKTSTIEPERDDPLHFDGELIVLVGAATYSSSVLFANTVQDYRFGRIAGARGGIVRSRQSGNVQETRLPNSDLRLYWPRFVLDRPLPRDSIWLQPDVIVRDDPFDPEAAIAELLTPRAAP